MNSEKQVQSTRGTPTHTKKTKIKFCTAAQLRSQRTVGHYDEPDSGELLEQTTNA